MPSLLKIISRYNYSITFFFLLLLSFFLVLNESFILRSFYFNSSNYISGSFYKVQNGILSYFSLESINTILINENDVILIFNQSADKTFFSSIARDSLLSSENEIPTGLRIQTIIRSTLLLETLNLYKNSQKNGKWLVKGVSLEVKRGEIVTLIGPNGSGKSTLYGTIIGQYKVDSGSISLSQKDITEKPIHERARLGINYLSQYRNVFNMSVYDNLMGICQISKTLLSHSNYYKNVCWGSLVCSSKSYKIEL